jgi:hypothetical protein
MEFDQMVPANVLLALTMKDLFARILTLTWAPRIAQGHQIRPCEAGLLIDHR